MISYNEEACIKRALDSIDFVVDEIIVVDSCSSDRTKEIATSYEKVKFYEHPFPNDYSLQRNICLSYASGEWVIFLDCDEFFLSETNLGGKIKVLAETSEFDAYSFVLKTFVDEAFMGVGNYVRMFRSGKGIMYTDYIHERPQYYENLGKTDIIIEHHKKAIWQEKDNHHYWNMGQYPGHRACRVDGEWRDFDVPDFSLPVIMFHKIGDYDSQYSVFVEDFEKYILTLISDGYNFVLLDDLHAHKCARGLLPEKPIILTFDDGYEDLYTNVYPILQKYNIKANAFIIPEYMGKDNFWDRPPEPLARHISWDQAREISDLISFQSHSVTHANFIALNYNQIFKEIQESKEIIERELSTVVTWFSYPYGCYDQRAKSFVIINGYNGAVTIGNKLNDVSSDLFELNRFDFSEWNK